MKFLIVRLYWFCTEKYWQRIFDKDLLNLKNKNFQELQLKYGLLFSPEVQRMCCTQQCLCVDFFYFVLILFSKIHQYRKIQFSEQFFVSISNENACAKFQRKIINSAELDPLGVLIFLDERPNFWQTMSPFQKQIHHFHYRTKIIRIINKKL